MAVDVCIRERCEWLVIHYDDVRRGAGLQDAERLLEVLGRNLAVVVEQHACTLHPGDVRHLGVVSLDDQEYLKALQHVMGVRVGTHSYGDALFEELQHRCTAYRIAHVGLRVIDYHRACLLDDVHLGWANMDAVSQECLFSEDAVVEQSVDRLASIVSDAVINVVHAL